MNRIILPGLGFGLSLVSVGSGLIAGSAINLQIGVPGILLNGIVILILAASRTRLTEAGRVLLATLLLSGLGILITLPFSVCMTWNLLEIADRNGLPAAVALLIVGLSILGCFVELFSQLLRLRLDGEPPDPEQVKA